MRSATAALLALALLPPGVAGALLAQDAVPGVGAQQLALLAAKERATAAERRSEFLRQEAINATDAADRLVAQRAVLSADIDAAQAQIEAANLRVAIITQRQREQRALLGRQSEPMLRLNAALQQMISRPASLIITQPGQREDYVHLRALMATVQPEIIRRTASLRQQIAIESQLRDQEVLALKSLRDAQAKLTGRRSALARLEGNARNKAGDFTANAAIEFEQAIAQGERARDLVGRIATQRLSTEKAAELEALQGPVLRLPLNSAGSASRNAYLLPAGAKIVIGFNELNPTGYRERGLRLAVPPSEPITAPAAGTVSFAGRYRSYGRIVIIEHGDGWNSLVTNLGSLSVKQGQAIPQGAVLGTAQTDNPEIGIELRKNGRVMDIAALLG